MKIIFQSASDAHCEIDDPSRVVSALGLVQEMLEEAEEDNDEELLVAIPHPISQEVLSCVLHLAMVCGLYKMTPWEKPFLGTEMSEVVAPAFCGPVQGLSVPEQLREFALACDFLLFKEGTELAALRVVSLWKQHPSDRTAILETLGVPQGPPLEFMPEDWTFE